MANFSEEQKQQVWGKGTPVNGYDSKMYRKDICGAWMQRDKYGEEEIYGWEIDHVYPESKGGDEELVNLRPMQWENNRSKYDNYPEYKAVKTSDGNRNIEKEETYTVADNLQKELKKKYNIN